MGKWKPEIGNERRKWENGSRKWEMEEWNPNGPPYATDVSMGSEATTLLSCVWRFKNFTHCIEFEIGIIKSPPASLFQ